MDIFTVTMIVFRWWVLLVIVGITFVPITSALFTKFFDKGYIFSKVIGTIAISYLLLIGGVLHVIPFSAISSFTMLGVCIIANLIFLIKKRPLFPSWKVFIIEELLFFLGLFVWSIIRGFQPDIHGLEKFMDFGFVNSILRSTYFPPRDMWMTPLFINYYYFGHLMTAVLTKLTFIPSFQTFNLMIATLFALTFVESFSIGANLYGFLRKSVISNFQFPISNLLIPGLLTAFLVTIGGNLHSLYTLFTPYQNENPVPPWQLVFSPQTFPNQYWYPNATRFIFHTIHEFPIYSFVVSDLHGHVLDIPLVLLLIAVLFTVFLTSAQTTKDLLLSTIILGFLTAVAYMTNAWDGLIYLAGSLAIMLYKVRQQTRFNLFDAIFTKNFLFIAGALVITFVVSSLPFSLFFKPFASQVGINCAPDLLLKIGHIGPLIFEKGYCQVSPWWQLVILYGFFLFWTISLISILFVAWKKKEKVTASDGFILFLSGLGILLIIAPEFVYLKDIYTTYFRANTMFKLVYQSFILLSLVSGYSIVRVFRFLKNRKLGILRRILAISYTLYAICLLLLIAIYPYFAINSYYNNLKTFQGLTGTTYLTTINQDDAKAIAWLNSNIAGQPVILEAQGDSYTDFARVSSNTGLPTVFGWTVHEWLWRGTYDVAPPRIQDITNLYESTDLQETAKLLKKYHISLVFVGSLERSKYKNLNEQKFAELGRVIFKSGATTIYQVASL